ncbi:hypothetical protein ABZ826_11270 [Streptomyces sp. NPDC047515]|uniref:hypothetical protein n=1 Tax=Streptomyces sp. NPDC047515 TaxID=3155380 RepID=UPI0033E7CD01
MIEPGGIPQYTGDFGQLEKAASSLRTHAIGIRNGGKDVHSRFQATAAYYKAPEADKLFSSTQPVMDTAEEFAGDIESLADALDTFIFEAKPHADRLDQLKLDAFTFVDSVRGDDDWTEDQGKVDAHQALMDGVEAAREAFQEAERNAANKINAISPGVCRPQWVVDDGTHGLGMYGQTADALKDVKDLPWGSPEGRTYERWSLEWWGHGAKSWAWDGIVKDSIWGGIDGLVTLAGFHGEQERDQAWDGLRRTAVGGYAYGMDLFGQDEHLTGWQRDSKEYAKEFGKQFVAYDTWEDDPARAHAVVSFNLLTLASGPLAAASKLGKGGTFARAAGTMAKIGDALDPLGGAFKAAKALSDLPKVSQVLANVSDHLQIPKTKFPDDALDLSDRYRVDKDGNFIPLDRDGTPNLDPAKREPSAAERGVGGRQGDREPVGVGARAPGAAAHAGDSLPPRGSHDAGGSSATGNTTHGPTDELGPARSNDGGHTGGGHGETPNGPGHTDGPGGGPTVPHQVEHAEGPTAAGHDTPTVEAHTGGGTDHSAPESASHPHEALSPETVVGDNGARPAAGHGEKLMEQLDVSSPRVATENGIITHVDGLPVADYLDQLARDRGAMYLQAKEAGTFARAQTGACVGSVIDLRTGTIIEGINGPRDLTIETSRLHPTLADRFKSIGDPPPHKDEPLGHAEVKAANELLWMRTRQGLPDDASALAEMRASVEFPFLKNPETGARGRSAPFCANCNHMLEGMPSSHGRFTGFPPSDENWIP